MTKPTFKPTLIVHTVYFAVDADAHGDPEREGAKKLGDQLYGLLTRPIREPLKRGPGIPVRIATEAGQITETTLEEAEHVVLIPVLGGKSHRRAKVRAGAIETLKIWLEERPVHHVQPVFTHAAWRSSEERLGFVPVLRELYTDLGSTVAEILLALSRALDDPDTPRMKLFISHAKADLEATRHAAAKISNHVKTQTTGESFFDSTDLLTGQELKRQLDKATTRDMLIAVRGDTYASRAWCQRELLNAKQSRRPSLSVEVLRRGEARSFPYAGNHPTLVWKGRQPDAEAHEVTVRAMVEVVAWQHFRKNAERVIEAAQLPRHNVEIFTRPPELLDIPQLRQDHPGPVLALHPDPELSVYERELLRESHPRLRLVTPSSSFRGHLGREIALPLASKQVALSLSRTPDIDGPDGFGEEHLRDAMHFIARTLLCAGAAIAYGGDFRKNGYTRLLIELIRSYNQTASQEADLLHSYSPADRPIDDNDDIAFTSHEMADEEGMEELGAAPLLTTPKGKVEEFESALLQSDARRAMEICIDARIIVGGKRRPHLEADADNTEKKDRGYRSVFPGIVEEAWRTLQVDKPLYVLGGFGGAAKLVADLLDPPVPGETIPPDLRDENFTDDARYQDLREKFFTAQDAEKLGLPGNLRELAQIVQERGQAHLVSDKASLEWNGLTVAENRTLFRARDPLQLASLIFKGLRHRAARETGSRLEIELVRGEIIQASGLELLVVPTFADVSPSDSQKELDAATRGAITRAQESTERAIPSHSQALDADYVWAADLGELHDAAEDPVRRAGLAAEKMADMALIQGFRDIGLTTFDPRSDRGKLPEIVTAMLEALLRLKKTRIHWYEADTERFSEVSKVLNSPGLHDLVSVSERALPERARPTSSRPALTPNTYLSLRRLANAAGEFTFFFANGNVLAPIQKTSLDSFIKREPRDLNDLEEERKPSAEELDEDGKALFKLIFQRPGKETLERIKDANLIIVHDEESSVIPFELLQLPTQPEPTYPALTQGLSRRLRAPGMASDRWFARPPREDRLSLLLVIDPKNNTKGAWTEKEDIEQKLKKFEHIIDLHFLVGEEATAKAIHDALTRGAYDILHFSGHAYFRGHDGDDSGLWCANGEYLTLQDLKTLKSPPRVMVFNACETARLRLPQHRLEEEPDFESSRTALANPYSFAEKLIQGGIEAYIGARWMVQDPSAVLFTSELYAQLAQGSSLSLAVARARKALFDVSNRDWANYQLYGDGQFRLVRKA